MWSLIFGDDEEAPEEEAPKVTSTTATAPTKVIEMKLEHPAHPMIVETRITKHRLPSPTRQAGDGMESSDKTQKMDPSNPIRKTRADQILLPLTNISLDKLPPILDKQVKLPEASPSTPLVRMTLSQPHRSAPRSLGHLHKSKDPKFVPYEPYKAAITPMFDKKKRNSIEKPAVKTFDEKQITSQEPDDDIEVDIAKAPAIKLFDEEDKNVGADGNGSDVDFQTQLDEKEAELAKLRLELAESEKMLRIQTQVNTEVKKLLVASVGEDIEAKVDYLTQDKARLAADIRQFSNQISKDFEEKENLSVQSDVWKSKFLASSVIVDELAQWKSHLLQQHDETDHYIRLLFHERGVLWSSLVETNEILRKLRTAFDPLGVHTSPNTSGKSTPVVAEAASVHGISDRNLNLARELRDRLLGETKLKTGQVTRESIQCLDSPAEEGLRKVMSSTVEPPSGYSELASVAMTRVARPHLLRMGDQLTAPTSFKCCTHCQGTVQIV